MSIDEPTSEAPLNIERLAMWHPAKLQPPISTDRRGASLDSQKPRDAASAARDLINSHARVAAVCWLRRRQECDLKPPWSSHQS